MKILSILSVFVLSVVLAGFVAAQQPALIDREVFFGNPEYAGAQISPDGKYISYTSSRGITPASRGAQVFLLYLPRPGLPASAGSSARRYNQR